MDGGRQRDQAWTTLFGKFLVYDVTEPEADLHIQVSEPVL